MPRERPKKWKKEKKKKKESRVSAGLLPGRCCVSGALGLGRTTGPAVLGPSTHRAVQTSSPRKPDQQGQCHLVEKQVSFILASEVHQRMPPLFLLPFFSTLGLNERERETDRQTDRQTDREKHAHLSFSRSSALSVSGRRANPDCMNHRNKPRFI